MRREPGVAWWSAAILAVGLFVTQAALAGSDVLTLRYVLNFLALCGVALGVTIYTWRNWRDLNGPKPESISLILAGLAALGVWAAALWLMDVTNVQLEKAAGVQTGIESLLDMSDSLLGLDIQAAAYELQVLFAVILIPLAWGWLWWGLVQLELGALIGRWRAAWLVGVSSGLCTALIAVQDVAPALPWGLASVGGYMLIGCVAALTVYVTGSPWAGFAAHATFTYAVLMWADDLFRHFRDKDHLDVEWLTVIVLGGFGAVIMLQAMRFRNPRPDEPERDTRHGVWRWLMPMVLLVAGLVVMAIVDIGTR